MQNPVFSQPRTGIGYQLAHWPQFFMGSFSSLIVFSLRRRLDFAAFVVLVAAVACFRVFVGICATSGGFGAPAASARLCVVLRVCSKVARCAKGYQVCRFAVFRHVVFVVNSQRSFVRVERFTRSTALLAAFLALPARRFLHAQGYFAPVLRVALLIHRHLNHAPFGGTRNLRAFLVLAAAPGSPLCRKRYASA